MATRMADYLCVTDFAPCQHGGRDGGKGSSLPFTFHPQALTLPPKSPHPQNARQKSQDSTRKGGFGPDPLARRESSHWVPC